MRSQSRPVVRRPFRDSTYRIGDGADKRPRQSQPVKGDAWLRILKTLLLEVG